MRSLLLASVLMAIVGQAAGQETTANLPKIVLLGDSIRLGYAPIVAKSLEGQAVIVSPKANGGDSGNTLKNLEAWAIKEQPKLVHFNCGIHDTKWFPTTGKFQVPPEDYANNLRRIVTRLREQTQATVCFALTTPIVDDRAAKQRSDKDYQLKNASTQQYNEIALRVMKELNVPVNDLRSVLGDEAEQQRLLSADGVHFTSEGKQKLADAVTAFVRQHLPAGKN